MISSLRIYLFKNQNDDNKFMYILTSIFPWRVTFVFNIFISTVDLANDSIKMRMKPTEERKKI